MNRIDVIKALWNPKTLDCHMPKLTLGWVNKDKFGKIIKIIDPKPCKSYIQNMIDVLNVQMSQTTRTIKDTGGANQSLTIGGTIRFDGPAGASYFGIVVGRTAGVTLADYAMNLRVDNGVGANQLQYGGNSLTGPVTVGSTRQFTIARTFTNNSGGDVTINEVGLIDYTGSFYFLVEHSNSTNTINNGASGTATYTMGMTV